MYNAFHVEKQQKVKTKKDLFSLSSFQVKLLVVWDPVEDPNWVDQLSKGWWTSDINMTKNELGKRNI